MFVHMPVVESVGGTLSYLEGSGTEGDPLRTSGKSGNFPDAVSLEAVRRARQGDNRWTEQYGHGRVANNLGAVYICTGRLREAFQVVGEAAVQFAEMLDNHNPHPADLTLLGLAVAEHNHNVLMKRLGVGESAAASEGLTSAFEVMSEISDLGRDADYDFLMTALLRLRA